MMLAANDGIFFSNNLYKYDSPGVILPGEPENIFEKQRDSCCSRWLPKRLSFEEMQQQISEFQTSRIRPVTVESPVNRGTLYFEPAEGGRRRFDLVHTERVQAPGNRILQYLGAIVLMSGFVGLFIEWRLRRLKKQTPLIQLGRDPMSQIRTFLAGATTMAAALAAIVTLTGARSPARHETFDEITVGRINIVEPDGTRRIVISNKAQFPGEFQQGKETARVRTGAASPALLDERFQREQLGRILAAADQVDLVAIDQHLGRAAARVVVRGHREAIGAGRHHGQQVARFDGQLAVARQPVARFADRADQVVLDRGAVARHHRLDVHPGLVQGRARHVVHGGVDHAEVLLFARLQEFHRHQQHAGIADDRAARLEDHLDRRPSYFSARQASTRANTRDT
jgi:hypothetical protein